MRQTLQGVRRVLRQRAFRRFWLGMLISRAGDAFTPLGGVQAAPARPRTSKT